MRHLYRLSLASLAALATLFVLSPLAAHRQSACGRQALAAPTYDVGAGNASARGQLFSGPSPDMAL